MRIFILGASSYTGDFLRSYLMEKDHRNEVYGTYRTMKEAYQNDRCMIYFDMEKMHLEDMKEILKRLEPDVIISCLRGDFLLQKKAHKEVISYLKSTGNGKLIYLSSSNVFDNDLTRIHIESDVVNSKSEYGKFKAECEKMILDSLGQRGIVLRPSFIMGKGCRRSVQLFNDIKNHRPVENYEDIILNYTPVLQIGQWILYILEHNLNGIFHIGTVDSCTYRELVKMLMQEMNLPEPEFKTEAKFIEKGGKKYQAVISKRSEIPENIQYNIHDMVSYLTK